MRCLLNVTFDACYDINYLLQKCRLLRLIMRASTALLFLLARSKSTSREFRAIFDCCPDFAVAYNYSRNCIMSFDERSPGYIPTKK